MWRHGLHVVPSSADGPLMPKHIDEPLYRHSIFDDLEFRQDRFNYSHKMHDNNSKLFDRMVLYAYEPPISRLPKNRFKSFSLSIKLLSFQVGMVLSNEPGYYHDGSFGIRLENLVRVVPAKTKNNFQNKGFLTFETMTLCPIQVRILLLLNCAMKLQCDQMARLFFIFWLLTAVQICPKVKKSQTRFKILPNLK